MVLLPVLPCSFPLSHPKLDALLILIVVFLCPQYMSLTRLPPQRHQRHPRVCHYPPSFQPAADSPSSCFKSLLYNSPDRDFFYSSYRPLPKRPEPPSELLETRNRRANVDRRSSTTNLASRFVTQRPIDMKEIRRENLSKFRHHLGDSVPSDLVAPRVDVDETSSGSRVGAEVYGDHPKVPITAERLLREEKRRKDEKDEKVVGSYRCRWLREEKGRRWVEDDYERIIQTLREL